MSLLISSYVPEVAVRMQRFLVYSLGLSYYKPQRMDCMCVCYKDRTYTQPLHMLLGPLALQGRRAPP